MQGGFYPQRYIYSEVSQLTHANSPPSAPPQPPAPLLPQVMELCDMRNDPTGNLRYSQEEGLSKRGIERLPQTRYKKPAAAAATVATAQKKADKKSPNGGKVQEAEGTGGAVPGPEGARPRTAAVGAESGAGTGVEAASEDGGQRDSTADMCAICLVEYEVGDDLRVLPACEHHFHKVGGVRACVRACCLFVCLFWVGVQ